MSFTLRPAVRENVPLLIGLAGGTGSGKTLSAMMLAKGLSGGKKFAVVDTESGRAKAYADDFDFDTGELLAPFRPEAYSTAITAVDALTYPVIVVDSCSHEYAGDGGILDWQEEELESMIQRSLKTGDSRAEWQLREAHKMRSWIEPKMSHKRFMTRLLQVRAHLILCFRAEAKTEIAKDEKGKTVIREKQGLTGLNGWFPICEKNMPYELTAYFLLTQERPGVPLPIKLMERHKQFFPADKPITEEAGRLLAAWAKGGAATPKVETSGLTDDALKDIETALVDAGSSYADLGAWLKSKGFASELAKLPKSKLPGVFAWIENQKRKATA